MLIRIWTREELPLVTDEGRVDIFTQPILLEKLRWDLVSLGFQQR
jgi:hypothetical protein